MFGESSAGGIVKKVCMSAFGVDIADFNTMLQDMVGAMDTIPTVRAPYGKSQMNTFDVSTTELGIMYMIPLQIYAGLGSAVTYQLILTCDKDKPDGEYCTENSE